MKLLVTGGAGFIGSYFIRRYCQAHPQDLVVNLDALTYAADLSSLEEAAHRPNYRFVRGDIGDRGLMETLFAEEQFDWVVHFAAESHVDRSIADPDVFLRTNVLGTGVLLDMAKRYEVKRFHQISTDEVYGDLPLDQPSSAFTEESPLRPSSPYSASKVSGDLLALSYHRTYGLPVTVSRCSNNYGTHQHREKLIPRMIALALAGEALPVYGTGENIRDWIAVEDHCTAVDEILHRGIPGEVYNVGAGDEQQNLKVVRTVLDVLGKPSSLIRFVEDRPGHDRRYAINAAKLTQALSWKPTRTLLEELPRLVAWYADHQRHIAI